MADKKTSGKISLIISAIVSILYCAANIIISQYHEAWRDEAQAWTIAKNLSIPEIFELMSTEGHFLPWFIVLKVWYVLGGTFAALSIISTIIMTIVVFIFMYKAPFNPIIKSLIVLSAPFFYYNAVISRCYCIVALAVVLSATTRKNKDNNPFPYAISLALLLQSHVLLFPFAIALFAEDALLSIISKSKKRILALIIPMLSLAIAFAELHQSKDQPTFRRVTIGSLKNNMTTEFMRSGLESIIRRVYNHGLIFYIVAAILIALLITFIVESILCKSKSVIFLLIAELGGVFGFIAIVTLVRQCAHIQMSLVFYLMILFCIWASIDETKEKTDKKHPFLVSTIVFTLICALSYKNMINDISYDISYRFSNSQAIAQDISYILPKGSTVIVQMLPEISSAYSYASELRPDITFWDIHNDEEYRCIIWGTGQHETTITDMDLSAFPENTYYLTAAYSDDGYPMIAEEAEENTWREYFYLFQLK